MAMDKLRVAIMGKRGKNLDDLEFMTGNTSEIRNFSNNYNNFLKSSAILVILSH